MGEEGQLWTLSRGIAKWCGCQPSKSEGPKARQQQQESLPMTPLPLTYQGQKHSRNTLFKPTAIKH